jgi:hypothetical protein
MTVAGMTPLAATATPLVATTTEAGFVDDVNQHLRRHQGR